MDAAATMVMSQKHILDGREVDVKPAVPRDKAQSPTAGAGGGIAAGPAARIVANNRSSKITATIITTAGMAESGAVTLPSGIAADGRVSALYSSSQPTAARPTTTSTISQERSALSRSNSPTTAHNNRGGRSVANSPSNKDTQRQGGGSIGGASGSLSSPQRLNNSPNKGGNFGSPDPGGGDYPNTNCIASQAAKASLPFRTSHWNAGSDGGSSAPSSPAGSSIKSEQARKVFVGGLAPSVTDVDFRAYFERFGGIVDAVVMFDRQVGIVQPGLAFDSTMLLLRVGF